MRFEKRIVVQLDVIEQLLLLVAALRPDLRLIVERFEGPPLAGDRRQLRRHAGGEHQQTRREGGRADETGVTHGVPHIEIEPLRNSVLSRWALTSTGKP